LPDSATALLLSSESLARADGDGELREPVVVRPREGWPEQKALFAANDFAAADVLFQEEPIFVTKDVRCTTGLAEAVRQFLKLPQKTRETLLTLHPREEMLFDTREVSTGGEGPKMDNKEAMLALLARTGAPVQEEDREEVWLFLRVLLANSFDHKDATTVYLWLSRANHSCSPNAVRMVVADKIIAVVALRPIGAGEEICITYVLEQTLFMPTLERQRRMRSMFGFDCACARCTDEEDAVRAFRCRTGGCRGARRALRRGSPGACSACGALPSAAEGREALRREAAILDLYNQLEGDREGGSEAIERALRSALEVLSELHWVTERLHHVAYQRHMRSKNYMAALEHQAAKLRFWDAHVRRPSLRRGIERSKLAEAHGLLGHFADAINVGCAAMAELRAVTAADREACQLLARPVHDDNPCAILRERLRAYLRGVAPAP